jgi:hypothetical protein
MGELVLDLRTTDLPPGDTPIELDLGVGEARVIVPRDVCVATDAHVGMGELRTFERNNEGIDVDLEDLPDARPRVTRLLVKADLGVGSLRIGHSASDIDVDHRDFDFGPIDDDLGANAGCVR